MLFVALALFGLVSSQSFVAHQGINCYPDHGGTPVEPSDTPLTDTSLEDCEQSCNQTATCIAVVVRVDGQQQGYCWLRSMVMVDQCETSVGKFDTYIKERRRLGSFFVLGDWGYNDDVHGNIKAGCQQAIGQAMVDKSVELGDVKFVVNVGDSFYPAGISRADDRWNSVWLDVYGSLTDLPWFSVYGNHDYQGGDNCACSLDLSECAQINPGVGNWVMPNVSYSDQRFLHDLNLEVVALDLNAVDYLDSGSMQGLCQYTACSDTCPDILNRRKDDALQLFTDRMVQSKAKNIVAFSHYPTDYLTRAGFDGLVGQLRDNTQHNIQYFGGHRHNVDQNTASIAPNTNWLVGGGGGWGCDGGEQGFVVGEVYEDFSVQTYSALVPISSCC